MERAARTVCTAFLDPQAIARWESLGNYGGFSGAVLWRVTSSFGTLCLRAWPSGQLSQESLGLTHHLLKKAARDSLAFVPQLLTARGGQTYVRESDRFWEMTTWLPGVADFHRKPTLPRLRAALRALARLHLSWESPGVWHLFRRSFGQVPAVVMRQKRLLAWEETSAEPIERAIRRETNAEISQWNQRAWKLLCRWRIPALRGLEPWDRRFVALQFCLGDPWHNHVLFEDEQVTGIVDYGSVRIDSPAADLARLIGSLVGDDSSLRQAAIAAYEDLRPLALEERRLVDVLDWTGVVVGAGNWLRWLYLEGKCFADRNGVVKRIAELVTRMETWNSKAHGLQPVGLD